MNASETVEAESNPFERNPVRVSLGYELLTIDVDEKDIVNEAPDSSYRNASARSISPDKLQNLICLFGNGLLPLNSGFTDGGPVLLNMLD